MARLARLFAIAVCVMGCSKSSLAVPDESAGPDDDESALRPDGGAAAEPAPEPCDPYTQAFEHIDVGDALAAGEDAEGTVYIASRTAGGHVVFVSEGTELVRQRIAETRDLGFSLELIVQEHTPPFRVIIRTEGGTLGGMLLTHVLEGPGHPGPGLSETVAPIGDAGLAWVTRRSVPGRAVFEHGAMLEDGRVMIVTRPEEDWAYQGFRVFVGPPDELVEHVMYLASRGATTYVEFDLDAQRVTAEFHSAQTGEPHALLLIGDDREPMTLLDEPPAGASYACPRWP